MLYRENGQFKSSYRADQQIFPILQDRIAIGLLVHALGRQAFVHQRRHAGDQRAINDVAVTDNPANVAG